MEFELKLKISVTNYGLYVDFADESLGETSRIVAVYSPDEHPEFDEMIGAELYAYIMDHLNGTDDEVTE